MAEPDNNTFLAQTYGRARPRLILPFYIAALAGMLLFILPGPGLAAPFGRHKEFLEYELEAEQNTGSRVGSSKNIGLFGTVEFRGALKNLPKWERVLKMEKERPAFSPNSNSMPESVAVRWKALAVRLRGKPLKEKLQLVNGFFNQWPHKTDMVVWGVEDYWAAPEEFLRKSGDCEDYAISKYYALRQLGIPADKLRIVVLVDGIRNTGHAVLIVYHDDEAYVLDNLTNLILPHRKVRNYMPRYSLNEEYVWRHIRPAHNRQKR